MTFFSVMVVVSMEPAIFRPVLELARDLDRFGCSQEPRLSDPKENLRPGGV